MKQLLTRIRVVLAQASQKELLALSILAIIACSTFAFLVIRISEKSLVHVPAYGGTYREGVIGSPRFINPLLATSQSDQDLTKLIYSGLLREDGAGGYTNDLAEDYSISEDGLTYTVNLRDNIYFHDGKPVTADDVLFTVLLAQNQALKSPKKVAWEGVQVSKQGDKTVVFQLKSPFPAFLNNLTLGILPKHLWKDLGVNDIALTDLNLDPVGSGPYYIKSVEKAAGIPKKFILKANNSFVLARAYIDTLEIHVYGNQSDIIADLESKQIDGVAGLSPDTAKKIADKSDVYTIKTATLPRIYAIFFNQAKSPSLVDVNVRKALSLALDKQKIIDAGLEGFAVNTNTPVPALLEETSVSTNKAIKSENIVDNTQTTAEELLDKAGYIKNETTGIREKKDKKGNVTTLSLTITTIGSIEEFKKVAFEIKNEWEKIGVQTDVKLFETGDINQTVIKNRDYDTLLYGTIVETDSDLYAFWHSSQMKDRGLNLSMYANQKVDTALTNIRTSLDASVREKAFSTLETEIGKDVPAIFLYSPYFIYITNKDTHVADFGMIRNPEDRWTNVYAWYIREDAIWNFVHSLTLLKKVQDFLH